MSDNERMMELLLLRMAAFLRIVMMKNVLDKYDRKEAEEITEKIGKALTDRDEASHD